MNYKKYKDFSTEDFVLDEYFMQWVLHPTNKSDHYWKIFLLYHPEKEQEINQASFIIKSIIESEPKVPTQRLDVVYQNVLDEVNSTPRITWWISRIAAGFLLLFLLGGVIFYLMDMDTLFPNELTATSQTGKGKIILPDGTFSEFEDDRTRIQQTASGHLTINNDTLKVKVDPVKVEEQKLAQILIPHGKRSEIALADGTRIWLNSGSVLSYPIKFTDKSRVVYLSGEALFEVESDPTRPFQVITRDMKIEATGTRFNVTAYANEPITQTILLSGIVRAGQNKRFKRPVRIEPGERIFYNNQEDILKKDRVNVELYSTWVNGYLLFENEPVINIFKKLERYYNENISAHNFTDQLRFTGKLDLADDLEKVLRNIGFSGSFSVEFEDGTYKIEKKN